jgi:hypothetical protein
METIKYQIESGTKIGNFHDTNYNFGNDKEVKVAFYNDDGNEQ